jgi:O-antigen/teichoic acid export membrane protein
MTDATSRFDLGGRTLREHAARGTIINAAFTIGISLLGFLRGFILAGLLAPDDYGIWGIILISLGTLGWLKAIGISDKYIQQEDADQELAFQRAFTLEAIFNTILIGLSLAAIPLIVVIYGHDEVVLPALACCLLLPAVTLQAPFWILYRKMQFGRQRLLQSIDPIISFVVAIAMAGAGAGYWAFVGGALAGAWAAAIAAMLTTPYPMRLRFDRVTAREYVGFSWPLLLASMGGIVVAQGSILVGEKSAGLAAAGAITLASSISMFTNRVDEVITSTLYPAICAVVDRTELLFESFVKSNRLALMWAMPFGFGLTLFAPDLVDFVLGDRWDGAVVLLQAFGAAAAIGHLGFNWGAYFRALNDTKPIGAGSLVQAAVFAAAAIPLTLVYELDGLAAGMLLTVVAGLVVRGIYLRRLFAGFTMTPHALRALAPSVPAIGIVLLVRTAESGERTALVAIARQPHRQEYELPIRTARSARWTCARSRSTRRLRADDLRPGVHEHRVVPQRDHLHRRRQGHPALPRLPDRAARRASRLPRDRLPDLFGELPTARSSTAWTRTRSRCHTMLHENIKKFMEGFRYDAHPMGMLPQHGRRAVDVLSRRQAHLRRESRAHMQIVRLIAKVPTHRRLRLPPQHRPPYVYPDNDLSFTGNFLNMLFKMTELKYKPNRCSSARSTCCSSCTPTTSRTAARARCARSAARTSIRTRRWPARRRRSTARCTAAPTRRCCGCSTRSARSRNIPASSRR